MDIILGFLIGITIFIAFAGLIFPVIPSSPILIAAFLIYGFAFSFEPLSITFWIVQGILFGFIVIADYFSNYMSVKKFGGSKGAIWGSTIGLIIGPLIIPIIGLIIGPFVGAILGELITNRKEQNVLKAIKVGIGSLIGFISSTIAKAIIMVIMTLYFIFTIF